jgi:hypothetical protein
MAYVIAPGITSDDYDESKRLDAFEKRSVEWIIAPAKRIMNENDSGIAVLMLSSSLLQPIGGIVCGGKGRNGEQFVAGFLYVFPTVKGSSDPRAVATDVCNILRNGLYHEAFVKHGFVIRRQADAVEAEAGAVCVDPKVFLPAIEQAVIRLCEQIRTDKVWQQRFDDYWRTNESLAVKQRRIPVDARMLSRTVSSTGAFSAVMPPFKKF